MSEQSPFVFYLGTHHPAWLKKVDIPLFVSRRRLAPIKKLPRALGPWMLDSGGFTELSMYGAWETTPKKYVAEVRRFFEEVGRMESAAPQDWMCEPIMLQRTGLSIREHQRRSVSSFLELRDRAPEIPWMPVLQGWTQGDYLRCVEMFDQCGVDLTQEKRVGVGTVCRRQGTEEARDIFKALWSLDLRLHGFGVKLLGLAAYRKYLASSDSLAWSFHARRNPPLPDCVGHKNCANCLTFALRWRERVA
jgi:hypothetical protein